MQKIARSRGVNDSGRVVGQDHHRAKFTDHEVWLMRELHADGMSYPAIAEKFDTNKWTVLRICTGQRRGHTVVGQCT